MNTTPTAAPGVAVEVDHQIDELMILASAWKHTTPCTGASVDAQDELRNALRTALLASAEGGPAEAVLQVKQSYGASLWANVSQAEYDDCTTEKRKLYAHPPAPVRAPQGPVTDEQIAKARTILARLCDRGLLSMSVPVRDDDEDMILSAIVDSAASRGVTGALPASPEPQGAAGMGESIGSQELSSAPRSIEGREPMATADYLEIERAFNAIPGVSHLIIRELMQVCLSAIRKHAALPSSGGVQGDAARDKIPDYTIRVPVGGGAVMFIANPMTDPHIGYSLTYSGDLNHPQAGRMSAAALIESYDYLVSDQVNLKEAARRLALMRRARRATIASQHAGGGE